MELYHHGIQGQKWGKRLYQNPDGSLTPLGRIRYGSSKNYNKKTKLKIKKQKEMSASEKLRQDLKKKNISRLSEEELRNLTRRYDALKEVEKRLSEGEKKTIKQKVLNLVLKSAEGAINDILKDTMKDIGKRQINKIINKMK